MRVLQVEACWCTCCWMRGMHISNNPHIQWRHILGYPPGNSKTSYAYFKFYWSFIFRSSKIGLIGGGVLFYFFNVVLMGDIDSTTFTITCLRLLIWDPSLRLPQDQIEDRLYIFKLEKPRTCTSKCNVTLWSTPSPPFCHTLSKKANPLPPLCVTSFMNVPLML